MRPLMIDLFCGLGGASEGALAEGYQCVGFDLERHNYGTGGYPGELVIQNVLTIHGKQFSNAAYIWASPPCQEYSFMAMPWKRGKQIAAALRGLGDFPERYRGSRTVEQLNALFGACFRIQKQASEAAGQHIPLIVENVKGAQPWVGRAAWSFGSYYLWGDVPALMPRDVKTKGATGSWFYAADKRGDPREASKYSLRSESIKQHGSGAAWFDKGFTKFPSRSERRKAASAQIARIPFPLANWIARVFKPEEEVPSQCRCRSIA